MSYKYWICPSILSADMARLGDEVNNVLKAGADRIHVDVMDNHYVPNLTFGPLICRALRDFGISAPLDIHLMVEPVDRLIAEFIDAGANCIVFHPEASTDIAKSLDLILQAGCQAGLAVNPDTSIDILNPFLHKIQRILLMSVYPGFAGQKFIPETLDKAKALRNTIDAEKLNIRLEIDGGVKAENIYDIAQSGIDTFVAGSAIFGQENYPDIIKKMRHALQK